MNSSKFHYWYLLRLLQVVYHWVNRGDDNVCTTSERNFKWYASKTVRKWMPPLVFGWIPFSLTLLFVFAPWSTDESREPGVAEGSVAVIYYILLFGLFHCSKNPKFMPRKLQILFSALDSAEEKLVGNNRILSGFRGVKNDIQTALILHPKTFMAASDTTSAEEVIYSAIVRQSGGMAGSGEFHLYRGLLNPLSGRNLTEIHDGALEKLVELGAIDKDALVNAKDALKADIAVVG